MPKAVFGPLQREPEVSLVGKLTIIENVCLATIAAVVSADIVEWFLPVTRRAWPPMSSAAATTVVLTALSLFFPVENWAGGHTG